MLLSTVHEHLHVGNHTFAVLRGAENYTVMKEGLCPVIEEINSLIERKVVEVGEEIIELKFYLGGDYKVCIIMFILLCILHSYI